MENFFFRGNQITVFTDHKPFIGAFKNSIPRISDKQQRQLSFISEYIVDIVHISGKDNVVADTLSRSSTIYAFSSEDKDLLDLPAIAQSQSLSSEKYKDFKEFDIGLPGKPLYCAMSQPNPRPVVTKGFTVKNRSAKGSK